MIPPRTSLLILPRGNPTSLHSFHRLLGELWAGISRALSTDLRDETCSHTHYPTSVLLVRICLLPFQAPVPDKIFREYLCFNADMILNRVA